MSRCFHAYCIGSGKTGTASVAAMFQGHYRSIHEAMPALTNQLAIEYDKGNLYPSLAESLLITRDRDLDLEMDSSHPLGFLAPIFARMLDTASWQFLVTVRDPVAWIRSRINYHVIVSPPEWTAFRSHFWWGWPCEYQPEDQYLKDLSLCPVSSYFQAYEKQYRLIKTHLPPARYVVVATERLSESIPMIARFLGVSPATINPAHVNKSPRVHDLSAPLPHEWLNQMALTYCPTAIDMWLGAK